LKLRVPYKMLSQPTPPFAVVAEVAALLLIDVQRFTTLRDEGLALVARERGIMREFDEYYAQTDAALRNCQRLVASCRTHGLRVIYTVLNAQRPDRSDLSRQLRISGLPIPVGAAMEEIRSEVAPAAGDLVLPRGTYSPFAGTDLLTVLRGAGVETIVLAGMLANTTVSLTAKEAADRDLGVIVVWDASASETLDWHDNMKTDLVSPLIRMRTTRQIIEMMEGKRT
jgi:ureidoacrylate peracid hydrolase